MGILFADIRHSVRLLLKSPGFTVVAVLALALGIGANTAIFSVVSRVLLEPLPFRESDRILQIERQFKNGTGNSASIPRFMAWRECTAFQSVAAYDFAGVSLNLGSGDRPNGVNAVHASSGFFDVFGVTPVMGRTYTPQEDLPHAGRFTVITFNLWKTRLSGDAGIVGKTIMLNSEPYVVMGVLPESFQPDPPTDLYIPIQGDPNSKNQANYLLVAGRLRPGATLASANAEMKLVGERFRARFPKAMDKDESIRATPLRDAISGNIRPALITLSVAVLFVLLMACANVANLLLARESARQKEIAIRTAVGAGRGRIIRQLLTESILLATAGGTAGLVLGIMGVRALLAASPGNIPRLNDPQHATGAISMIDWHVLAFLFALSLLTGILFGFFPALQISRLDVHSVLKESSNRSATSLRHNRVRALLVISEIALALVLLIGATLMIRSFAGIRAVKPGYDPHNVLTLRTSTASPRYNTTAQLAETIRLATTRIEAIPGVQAASSSTVLPTEGDVDMTFEVVGKSGQNAKGDEYWRAIAPHFFDALRIPLVRGRVFNERDTAASPLVVIISEKMAQKYWPNQDPIGQRIIIGADIGSEFFEGARQVVGIVGSVHEHGLQDGIRSVMYIPYTQVQDTITRLANSVIPLSWVIKTQMPPAGLSAAIQAEFVKIDPSLLPLRVQTMDQLLEKSTSRQQFDMLLLSVFAAVALLLAASGIYGLMAYNVEQRTQEIGIRMALGAGRSQVTRMVLGQGMTLAAIGVVIGLAGAWGLTRFLASFLFGVKASDPPTFTAVAAVLAAIALVASLVPARRAMRIDPVDALRHE
jgi:putative ABC transport system permease protein